MCWEASVTVIKQCWILCTVHTSLITICTAGQTEVRRETCFECKVCDFSCFIHFSFYSDHFFTCFYDVVKKNHKHFTRFKFMQRVCIFKFWSMATHSCLTGAPSCSQFVGFCLSSCFLKTNKTKNIPKTKVFQRSRCNLKANCMVSAWWLQPGRSDGSVAQRWSN